MRLASLRPGQRGAGRDGRLLVVSADLARAVAVDAIAPTLQSALDEWALVDPKLRAIAAALDRGTVGGSFAVNPAVLGAPLPRAFQFLDASAYLNHVELVRQARGAELPPGLHDDPLMYQAASDGFLGPRDPIRVRDAGWGLDFEGEVGVIVDDVPMGATPAIAAAAVRLVVLVNDVSLRHLVAPELAKGFGFVQSKPASALSPVAVTPDALGAHWDGGRLRGRLLCRRNGELFGDPDAGVDMAFDFPTLIAHAARTRALSAGTLIGGGTVSNRDPARGAACIAEVRCREMIADGEARTPFLADGERVAIEMVDKAGRSLFGAIDQVVRVG